MGSRLGGTMSLISLSTFTVRMITINSRNNFQIILYFNEEIGQNHQISHMLIWHCATLAECFIFGMFLSRKWWPNSHKKAILLILIWPLHSNKLTTILKTVEFWRSFWFVNFENLSLESRNLSKRCLSLFLKSMYLCMLDGARKSWEQVMRRGGSGENN